MPPIPHAEEETTSRAEKPGFYTYDLDDGPDPLSLDNRQHRLLIVGNPSPIHVGAHLFQAAQSLGLSVTLCDTNAAFDAPWPLLKFNWALRGRRPPKLKQFGRQVIQACKLFRPQWLIATGLAPLPANDLNAIRRMGVAAFNYLTDDPWNPAHRAPWFFRTLPVYDHVFTPRRANLADLIDAGCRQITYLPFAYNPQIHFPQQPDKGERELYESDIFFAGGADQDRIPWVAALIRAGFRVALYGGYWERYPETREHTHGHADMETLRKATSGAKVCLCLVRRANRDGNVMRSFEIPAMGGCMLAEDTDEHRELLGADGEAVVYFESIPEMLTKLRWLLDHEEERRRLATSLYKCVVTGPNTYAHRLANMLKLQVRGYS